MFDEIVCVQREDNVVWRPDMNDLSEMIIYTTEDGLTKVNVNFDGDTVWLTQEQMSELF